jgi:putative ABC transport system substrate-binding protein
VTLYGTQAAQFAVTHNGYLQCDRNVLLGLEGKVLRRDFITLIGRAAAAWPLAARAEQTAIPAVGFLSALSAAALTAPVAAFRDGLQSVGYSDGKNVEIEFRWANGHYDQLPALAAELVRHQVRVIVTVGGDPPAFAAKAASTTIPIVFMVGRDPVELGLVASLSRPGGNATGINLLISEIESKRIELMRQLAPTSSVFAVFVNPKNADAVVQLNVVQSAAHALNQRIKVYNASSQLELEKAFGSFKQDDIGGFILVADPFFVNRRDEIISSAAQGRIPAVYFLREFAESGGLASYGTSLAEAYRQAGIYAGKILNGSKPTDLPVVQSTKFDLVINLKTAKALGLTVPSSLLATADEVIE